MPRADHEFRFTADRIAKAAKDEADYHRMRAFHWADIAQSALERVKETISARVTELEVTGGKQASVVVEYGDLEAWKTYNTAYSKLQKHRAAVDRYTTDARLYGTQGQSEYMLDSNDVHHFRLGGQPRED